MKYEMENQQKPGMMDQGSGSFKRGPDTKLAAKSGTPQMTPDVPTIPASIPVSRGRGTAFQGDVTASTVTDPTALDNNPDAAHGSTRAAGAAGRCRGADAAATPRSSSSCHRIGKDEQPPKHDRSRRRASRLRPRRLSSRRLADARPAPAATNSRRGESRSAEIDDISIRYDRGGSVLIQQK